MADLKTRVSDLNSRISKALDGGPMDASPVFVGTLLFSGVVAHLMHLQTRSLSEHMALGAYYEGIEDLVDSFAEAYQGKYGLISGYPVNYGLPSGTAQEYIRQIKEFVATSRSGLPSDTELQNIVDEISALVNTTLYKLTFLS